jgi:hypothetical protein
LSVTEFKIQGRVGRLVTFGEGDYLNVELHDGYCALAWASDLPLTGTLKRVASLLPDERPTAVVFDRETGSRSEREMEAIDEMLERDPNCITFLRLAFDVMSVTWGEASAQPYLETEPRSSHGQVGLISHFYNPNLISEFLVRTGTPSVVDRVKELLEHTAYLADYVDTDRMPGVH